MLQQRCREKRITIILWFLLLLRNCIYNSESYLERLGFTLKERCVCVQNITRAKMKHVVHCASLDSPIRINASNCVLSLACRIFTNIHGI